MSIQCAIILFSLYYIHSKQMALIPVLDMLNHYATVEVVMLLLMIIVSHCFPCLL